MPKQSTTQAFGSRKRGVKLRGIHVKLAKETAKDDANISGDSSDIIPWIRSCGIAEHNLMCIIYIYIYDYINREMAYY